MTILRGTVPDWALGYGSGSGYGDGSGNGSGDGYGSGSGYDPQAWSWEARGEVDPK